MNPSLVIVIAVLGGVAAMGGAAAYLDPDSKPATTCVNTAWAAGSTIAIGPAVPRRSKLYEDRLVPFACPAGSKEIEGEDGDVIGCDARR